jgi:hypothetical protein
MVSLCAAAVVLVVFALSATGKLVSKRAFDGFADSMGAAGFGYATRSTVAGLVVVAEICVAVSVLVPVGTLQIRLVPAMVLSAVFSAFLLWKSASRLGAWACHCFGSATPVPAWLLLCRNAVLMGVTTGGVVTNSDPSSAGVIVFSIGLGAMIGIAIASTDRIYSALRIDPMPRAADTLEAKRR